MASGKKKQKKVSDSLHPIDAVGDQLRTAIRKILRDWKTLRAPLPVDALPEPVQGDLLYRVRGAESYEELQQRVITFAGLVWQLKDGLIQWLRHKPDLTIVLQNPATAETYVGTGGEHAKDTIEAMAKNNVMLLICADLYNDHKHYTNCNRSKYAPFLSEVRLAFGEATGGVGMLYDGAKKIGDFLVRKPAGVPWRVEVHSRTQPVNFGDAVLLVGRGFQHWMSLVRQMELLSSHRIEDKVILDELDVMNQQLAESNPFLPEDQGRVKSMDGMSVEDVRLHRDNPAAFAAKYDKTDPPKSVQSP